MHSHLPPDHEQALAAARAEADIVVIRSRTQLQTFQKKNTKDLMKAMNPLTRYFILMILWVNTCR
jgi:hypothetical protein